MSQDSGSPPPRGDALPDEVSVVVERVNLDRYGKGPLHTETFITEDVITSVLRDVFTRAEKEMIENGQEDSVLVNRMRWQGATEEEFRWRLRRHGS